MKNKKNHINELIRSPVMANNPVVQFLASMELNGSDPKRGLTEAAIGEISLNHAGIQLLTDKCLLLSEYYVIDGSIRDTEEFDLDSEHIHIINADPTVCVDDIEDETFDLLYVGKTYSYLDTLQILSKWLPKIKVGGWIAGGSYNYDDPKDPVTQAIHDFDNAKSEDGTAKLDTRWLRYQKSVNKKYHKHESTEWRIKRLK